MGYLTGILAEIKDLSVSALQRPGLRGIVGVRVNGQGLARKGYVTFPIMNPITRLHLVKMAQTRNLYF